MASHVAPGVDGNDCPGAWSNLVAEWAAAGLGTIDDTGERIVDAALTVGFVAGQPGDLCTPSIAAGYLGAENQTIRVQLTDADHFTWSFDNGAPFYRATLAADQRTLTLLTDPRDRAHWPAAGQIVEILPWSAVLPNGEKLAEETGHLARVATSFDPDTHELVLSTTTAVPANFGTAWLSRPDAGDLGTPFFYVRVWNRGDDHTSPERIPFVVNTAVPLGTTGLTVTITGGARVTGDHWIIAARPRTPDRVVPWELEVGRGVHGVRRFFAPLALVRWHQNGTWDLLHDCRPHFLPLTRLRGCCTYTVGDEVHSFGRFTSIQAAVDALPAEGGKICVLPGSYRESVVLLNRQNITIEGCGVRSLLRPGRSGWVIVIAGGHDITVRDLGFETGNAFGIVVLGDGSQQLPASITDIKWLSSKTAVKRLRFHHLTMRIRGRSAIAMFNAQDVEITDCEITADPIARPIFIRDDLGRWPSILSFADDVLIERNRIAATSIPLSEPDATTPFGQPTFARTCLGGIQIGGGSERVEIRRNHITGGNGTGITLGSWAWAVRRVVGLPWPDLVAGWNWVIGGFHITINEEGCIEIDWDPPPPGDDNPDLVPVSMGAVEHVRIVDNLIEQMGQAGIGVARFFDLRGTDELILVRDLHIQDNRIHENLRLPIPTLPERMQGIAAQGAILLAEVERLVVRGNDIARNGKRSIDPVCGVFALIATNTNIENNRIVDNAPSVTVREPVRPGWRGGVVLPCAYAPTYKLARGRRPLLRQNGEPAVRIADNVIVVPEGRAILVLAHGAVAISDNELTTRGPGLADIARYLSGGWTVAELAAAFGQSTLETTIDIEGGIAVYVANVGVSNEFNFFQLTYMNLKALELLPLPNQDDRANIAASGNILFHGNQVGIDLLARSNATVLTGLYMATHDDVQGSDNQIEVDLVNDRVMITWYIMAVSTRITANRVKEPLRFPGPNVPPPVGTSITSIGAFMNMTTTNQTTRCISVSTGSPPPRHRTAQPNHVLQELYWDRRCEGNQHATDAYTNDNINVAVAEWS